MKKYTLFYVFNVLLIIANAQPLYVPPAASRQVMKNIHFDSAIAVGAKFRARFHECETSNTCNGVKQKFGCRLDPGNNTVLLKFTDGTIFFDAKMGLDADGSPLAKKNATGTDQPETSFKYEIPGHPSVDADKVPFIVIPGGGFGKDLGLQQGDIAAVVFDTTVTFAMVADVGPMCKIGEGSIELHEELGHHVCSARNASGECIKLRNTGISKNVLYFIFPHSKISGLTPGNAKEKIKEEGQRLFSALNDHT